MAYQSDTDSTIELGYWLGQPYWGAGLMSEAVGEIIRLGFGRYALPVLVSSTDPRNSRSQNVLRKAGFSEQGLVPRPEGFLRGGPEILLWRLTREDYQASMGITLELPR